jgi:hypothetical protein
MNALVTAAPWLPGLGTAAVVVTGALRLRHERRPYRGRHRAALLSTAEMNQIRSAAAARVIARMALTGPIVLDLVERGGRLPRQRISIADVLDEWTAEHGSVAA